MPSLLLLLGLLSCLPVHSASKGPVLVVAISGRMSCGAYMNANDSLLESHLSRQAKLLSAMGYQVQILSACFGRNLQVAWSLNQCAMHDSPADVLFAENYLVDILNDYADIPIALTAHSYGGFLALKLLLNPYGHFRYHYLATLDPISFRYCDVDSFLSMDGGCQQFPPDFSAKEIEKISEETDAWTNVFQTQMKRLHSGPARGAYNLQYFTPKADAHDQMARDPYVINLIARDLSSKITPHLRK